MSIPTLPCLKSRPLLLALVAVLLLAVPAARAQDPNQEDPEKSVRRPQKPQKPPPVNLVVRVGHDNFARAGRITPVQVTLDNNEEGFTGRLELRGYGGSERVTSMPIDLPKGGHKQYTLYAPLQVDESNARQASGELLVYNGRRMIAREELTPKYLTDSSLILTCTGEGGASQFAETDEKFRIAHRSPQDLPRQWAGYEPADVVALNGAAWTAMDEDQRRALRIWIEQGGSAILCGEKSTEFRDPDGASIAGVVPTEVSSEPQLDCVAELAGSPYQGRTGSVLTVSGPLNPGAVDVRREGGRPLIVVRSAVLGRVVWLGFDPFRENLRVGWDDYFTFWLRLLELARKPESSQLEIVSPEGIREAARALPKLPAPPLAAVAVFGVVYAGIFGPFNIWVLRRLRRTVKSWLFMPSLALGMTLVVLFVGQWWGNARIVLNGVSLLHGAAGGRTALEQSLVGLFSPTNRSFDLTVDDPAPALSDEGGADASEPAGTRDFNWPDRQEEGTGRWDAVALQLFSIQLIGETRPRDLGGSVDVNLDGRLAGTVKNSTMIPMRNAYLYRRGRFYPLGTLDQGKQVKIDPAQWAKELGASEDLAGTGSNLENRKFQENLEQLWRNPGALIGNADGGGGRSPRDTWFVAECPDYRGGLEVSGVGFNNRTGLIVLRVPERLGDTAGESGTP